MVYQMSLLEQTHNLKINNLDNSTVEIKTNIGVLADQFGAGKTLEIITLIANSYSPCNYSKQNSPFNFQKLFEKLLFSFHLHMCINPMA